MVYLSQFTVLDIQAVTYFILMILISVVGGPVCVFGKVNIQLFGVLYIIVICWTKKCH
jgi:hypothetical protein